MKAIKREARQSSLVHQKIREASFVPIESQDTETFKYNIGFKSIKYINDKFIVLKTICNKIIQKPRLWLDKINFKAVINDTTTWFIEAIIEGFLINFSFWALIGWKFNLITILAWGIAIKYLLGIYWRLKKNGSPSTVFKEHE